MKRTLLILCIAALLCMNFLAAPTSAETLTVAADGTGDYITLSAALNEASSGDTIYLQNGVYSESDSITINKANITIKGEGADKVILNMLGNNLNILAPECYIEDMKFQSGLKIISIGSPNCVVRNNIFENFTGYIDIFSSYNLISNNSLLNPSPNYGGIIIENGATNNSVSDNVIIGAKGKYSGAAIYGSNNLFENNTIRDGSYGGLRIGATGINNTISNNSFINNPTAGIVFSGSSNGNNIYLNSFIGNGNTVSYTSSKPSTIYWISPSSFDYTYNGTQQSRVVGNYWGSSYSGTDSDDNGIVDTSYTVPNSLGSDTAPLMGIWQDGNIISPYSVKPCAGFTASSFAGQAPFAVQFTGWSSGPGTVTSYLWDFGDGTTSTEQKPSHTYTTGGGYTVKLTVTGPGGSDSIEKTDFISVTSADSDLTITSLSSLSPYVHNTVIATIKNQGTMDAGSFKVQFTLDGNITNFNIPRLAAGNTTTINVTDQVSRKSGDIVQINIKLDTENTVAESNESNNEYTTLATVITGDRYQGGRYSVGYDLVNNVVYEEGNSGVAVAISNGYVSKKNVTSVIETRTFTADNLKIPAGATIISARLYQGWSWYGNPGFTIQFNGHESQGPVASYADNINGQDVYDVTSYFNTTGDNTVVLTSSSSSSPRDYAYYGTVLIVVYKAASEPNRQIWINEGSDCLLYGTTDPYVSYTLMDNLSTSDVASAKITTVLESRDGNDGIVETLNGHQLNYIGSGESDPSFMYFDATSALQNGINELGVNGSSTYTNYAASILEVTKVTVSEANFTSNTTSGNAPLAVKFTDTSTGTPTSWTWDFGDGSTSTEQNPTHTYTTEGAYNVTLTVSNSLESDSEEKTGYITVGSAILAPVAEFSSNVTSGQAPLTVQFTDESINTPTSWAWDFGDGKSSTEQNASHTYETVGTYSVKLTASNYGGSNSTTKADYISVTSDVSAPVANFTTDVNSGQVPFTVHFTDTSTGSVSSWEWNFGDGSTSTEQNPTHTYVTVGSYNVNLTATGPGGSSTTTLPVTVSAPLTSNNYNGGIPLTNIQKGTVSGGLWYDSYPGFSTSAQKTFTLPAYTDIKWARLYVTVYDGHMQNNYRGNVTIGIDANGDSAYEIQKNENFDTSYSFPGEGGTGPIWVSDHMNRVTSDYLMWYDLTDAINGQTVNVQATTSKIDSSFDGRVKAMTLVVAYDDGDSDQVNYWVNQGHDTVNPNDEEYTGSTSFGTSSLTSGWSSANLTAIYLASTDGTYSFQGTTLASGVKAGSYFGYNVWDISSLLTAGQDSALAYNKQGSNYYKIPLAFMSVRYPSASPALPEAAFTADVTSGTVPLTVNFTDQSTGSPNSWLWNFGDNSTATEQNTSHTYSAAGNYTVNLTVSNAAGSDSEVKTEYITVSEPSTPIEPAPVAEFTADVTSGTAPLTVNFTDQSTGTPSSWLWNFGDSATATEQNSSHTYTSSGTYTVNLTVTNSAGSNTSEKVGYITVNKAVTDDLTIGSITTVPGSAVFAKEPNSVKVTNIKNNGTSALTNVSVSVYASDVSDGTVPVNTTTIASLASGGTSTVTLIDPTIRSLEGSNITYSAVVDPENLIPENNEANNKVSVEKPVKYNGYKGKRYWEGGSDINTKQTYDLQGNLLYSTQPSVSAYAGVNWTGRTETWTASDLPIPSGPTIEKVLLYVSYNWDITPGGVPSWTAVFNSNSLTNGTLYTDKSNFGSYPNHTYGLYVFDVTNQFNSTGNSLVMTPGTGNSNALYPSTLVVVYKNSAETRKQIFINEECDELAYNPTGYGTTLEEATAYAPFTGMDIDLSKVENATLYSFAGSAGTNEGNLLFNGNMVATSAWQGDSGSSSAQVFNVKNYLNETGNVAGIQGSLSGGMDALQQILVVEYQKEQVPAPVANFTENVTSGKTPLTVKFDASTSQNADSYSWDFGDGSTGTGQIVEHTFADAGEFKVNLTVANDNGTSTAGPHIITAVAPSLPVAAFTENATSGMAPLTVKFDASTSQNANSYSWDFGDGNTGTGQIVEHTFADAGEFKVNLTVANDNCTSVEGPHVITVTSAQAALSITKTADPTTFNAAGQTITYNYTVTNTGNVPVSSIVVTDDKTTVALENSNDLAPGSSVKGTGQYTIIQADMTAGSVTNSANATGTYNGQTVTSNTVTATVTSTFVANADLSLTKTADPTTYNAAGQTITYNYTVTNTGNVPVSGIAVTDDKTTVTLENSNALAPGSSVKGTAQYTIKDDDITAGSVTNSANATGTYNGQTVTSNTVTATVTSTFVPNAALTITETANVTSYSAAGQVIKYTYNITNTGNTAISAPINVSDNKTGNMTVLSTGVLAPGVNVSGTAIYTIQPSDIANGSITNSAYAIAGSIVSNTVNVTVPKATVQGPALTMTKTANPTTYSAGGQKITYTYIVTNSGTKPVRNIAVTDNKISVSISSATLAPGSSVTGIGTYTIKQSDINAGSVSNIAYATGRYNGKTVTSNKATATVTSTAIVNPALTITKTANPTTYNAVGQKIKYTYTVTNTGTVPIRSISVTDNKTSVSISSATLAPGSSVTGTGTYTIKQSDINAGLVSNSATATGIYSGKIITSNKVTATVTSTYVPAAALKITKTADPTTYKAVGKKITYTYTVKNTGNVPISGIKVTDDKVSVKISGSTLAAGKSVTGTGTYTITQADINAGSVTNTATASGKYNGQSVTSNQATATVTALQNPALTITKTASPTTYSAAGQKITYTYTVTNSGNVPVTGIAVTDNKATVTINSGTLAPGSSVKGKATYTITQADINARSVTNIASATGTFNGRTVTSKQVAATVKYKRR